jgi:integrase
MRTIGVRHFWLKEATMAKKLPMTWYPQNARWRKCVKGKWYTVSCKELGVAPTKEASWRAMVEWWEKKQQEAASPDLDEQRSKTRDADRLANAFESMDEDSQKRILEKIFGEDQYAQKVDQARSIAKLATAASPERTIAAQIATWQTLLRSSGSTGKLSAGRYDAYFRNIDKFAQWIGPDAAIDTIDEDKVEGYFNHLSAKIGRKEFKPSYVKNLFMTAKQFIKWMASKKLIPLPANIDERRFRFNHSSAGKIEVFTIDEVREILDRATGRMRLYLLLMIQAGFYQSDVADLRNDEIDWRKGTITRARSKTKDTGSPVVTYKLWPETLELLKRYRSDGELTLTTNRGTPLVKYDMEGEKLCRSDSIQMAWTRMGKARLPMMHLRKTAATILATHPQYKFYTDYFLAHAPDTIAKQAYVIPSDAEFADAIDWLRIVILGPKEV